MPRAERRKAISATPFMSMNGRQRYRLMLECGHTVTRAKVLPDAVCDLCPPTRTPTDPGKE